MNSRSITFVLFFILFICACREKYDPGIVSPTTGYLVVEGYINNAAGGISTITLSRTTKLADTGKIVYERMAQVSILGETGGIFKLTETGIGVYTSTPLTLDASDRYRLHIVAQDGKEYLSDYSTMRTTPVVDSISWTRDTTGVDIYVNAHDDQQKTKYYRWTMEQTWEFHSKYLTSLKFFYNARRILDVAYRLPDTGPDLTLFKCWKTIPSTSYLLGTTEKLTKDVIFLPFVHIPKGDWALSILYSIIIKQYALSQENYKYLERMRKNTQTLGSIFDAQPSDAQGNIHCVTNAKEPVVGFVEVTQEQQKRIFISNTELPGWNYKFDCAAEEEIGRGPSLADPLIMQGREPTLPASYTDMGEVKTLFIANPLCIDCTLRGVNVKPSFWP